MHKLDVIGYKKKAVTKLTSVDSGIVGFPWENFVAAFFLMSITLRVCSIVIFRLIGQNGVIGQTMLMKML